MKYVCLKSIEPGKLPEMTGANALQTKRPCVGQEQFKRQDKPSKREEHR
jgi:hypothetical protein